MFKKLVQWDNFIKSNTKYFSKVYHRGHEIRKNLRTSMRIISRYFIDRNNLLNHSFLLSYILLYESKYFLISVFKTKNSSINSVVFFVFN